MSGPFEAAFVFGHVGNLAGALGDGWSIEDHYAWAVGEQSRLHLPLPGDDGSYVLHLTLHPLVQPGMREVQRVTLAAGDAELGHFELKQRTTLEIPLPPELTRNHTRLDLTITHPDALRPRDFKDSPDSRWLSVCFHSGGLVRTSAEPDAPQGEVVHAIVAGHHLARQIVQVMSKLPLLQDRVVFHHVAPEQSLDMAVAGLPAGALQSASIFWRQSGVGTPEVAAALRDALAEGCEVQRFSSPRMTALWPFLGPDPRRIAEPGRYNEGRYPYSDRVAASLANMMLFDDVVLLSYESIVDKEMPDLDAHLEADLAAWRQLDAANDIHIADFILDNFRTQRLFSAPPLPTAALLRQIIDQLIATPAMRAIAAPRALARELDFLMAGYVGEWRELPIHPHIARHFGLQWWQPGMRYRWFGNLWTFEQYTLDYLRWNPWRP